MSSKIPTTSKASESDAMYNRLLGEAVKHAESRGFSLMKPAIKIILLAKEGFVGDLCQEFDATYGSDENAYRDVLLKLAGRKRLWGKPWRWGRWFGLRDDPKMPLALCRTDELLALVRWCRRRKRFKAFQWACLGG
jgi:hypothetical protein